MGIPVGNGREPVIAIRNLTKRFGPVTAIVSMDLDVCRGEFFGLVGPNGAGKTTLMNLLIGQRVPDGGTLSIFGRSVAVSAHSIRRSLGFVPQTIALYDELSAVENLKIFGSFYGLRGPLLRERVQEALAAVQLTDRKKSRVKHFSGGMKRRLNLAASLLHHPSLLLCDEPTVGVDPQSRNAIFDLLISLNAAGTTIVYTSHYMEEIERLCTRIAIVDRGRIEACGTSQELMTRLPSLHMVSVAKPVAGKALAATLAQFGDVTDDADAIALHPVATAKLSDIMGVLEREGIGYQHVQWKKPSLEDLFLHLTGRRMRD